MFIRNYRYFIIFALSLSFQIFAKGAEKLVLIINLYNEAHEERISEYLECLNRNFDHPQIDKIHVFYDTTKDETKDHIILDTLKSKNLEITFIEGRISFKKIFDFANTNYQGWRVVLANADIYFDETLQLAKEVNLFNSILALTRWNIQDDGTLKPYLFNGQPAVLSQDVWIFDTPIKNFDHLDIKLGTAFCDGYIAYLGYKAGYKLFNPCLSIISHHLHKSNVRNWEVTPILHPILTIDWCTIENPIYPSKNNSYIP